MVQRISYNWSAIVKKAGIFTETEQHFYTETFKWNPVPLFPTCQMIDFHHLFNISTSTPPYIYFRFDKVDGLGLTVFIKERNKMSIRPLKSSYLSYEGAKISISNLNEPRIIKTHNKISKTVKLSNHQKCADYPTTEYNRFYDCDLEFVKKTCEKYNIWPFWVAESFQDVTKTR